MGTNKPVLFQCTNAAILCLQICKYKYKRELYDSVVGQVKTYQTKLQTLFGLKFMLLKINWNASNIGQHSFQCHGSCQHTCFTCINTQCSHQFGTTENVTKLLKNLAQSQILDIQHMTQDLRCQKCSLPAKGKLVRLSKPCPIKGDWDLLDFQNGKI